VAHCRYPSIRITEKLIPKLRKACQPPLSYSGTTPDADRARRPSLAEPSAANEELSPGDRVEGFGQLRKADWGIRHGSCTYSMAIRMDRGLPERPSNEAHPCIFVGVSIPALFVGANAKDAEGVAVTVDVVGLLFMLVGISARKPADELANTRAGRVPMSIPSLVVRGERLHDPSSFRNVVG